MSLLNTRAAGLPRTFGNKGLATGDSNGSYGTGNGPSAIMPRANRRDTPSWFMMNGIVPRSGGMVGTKSGTSAPPQFLPFQNTYFFASLQGLPSTSAEAR